ncbi:YbfB/YjiJ family MFS transporter [Micromonospora halotolerans]|uniref:YbfB/YjiJ family MFS transporter n=1 Tax=Micromonospora halotolerans TaxID=709879 RepID=A0ABZ0A1T3_9ACTN|nr:YbfB/YjiJ family MFS transporter [Micromonospora halotolerans]WNM41369.1 YbfB/YjiJ family MFS transporter [Micromonospora halotolerans]
MNLIRTAAGALRSLSRRPPRVYWTAARLALGTASALGISRFAYGLLLPAMRTDLGWSLAQAGALTTANSVGYLLGAAVAGVAARRWGSTATFRLGMLITAVALAATAVSSAYPALLTARLAAGAGGALVFVAGGVIASRSAAAARSPAPITIYFSGAGLGIAVSAAWLPSLATHAPHDWRMAWTGLAVCALLATAVSWAAARVDEPEPQLATGRRAIRHLWRTAVAYLLFAGGYIAYVTFLSAALFQEAVPTWQVSTLWAFLGSSAMVAPPLWSPLIGAWPPARVLTTLLALLAGASALPLVSSSYVVLAVSAVVYGGTFMTVPAAVTATIRGATRPEDWAPTLAAFTTVFAAGQTVGPWAAGTIADHTSADATLVWAAALCAAATLVAATRRPQVNSRGSAGVRPLGKRARVDLDAG